jgi:hypothetical protein
VRVAHHGIWLDHGRRIVDRKQRWHEQREWRRKWERRLEQRRVEQRRREWERRLEQQRVEQRVEQRERRRLPQLRILGAVRRHLGVLVLVLRRGVR